MNELDDLPQPERNDTEAKLSQTAVNICRFYQVFILMKRARSEILKVRIYRVNVKSSHIKCYLSAAFSTGTGQYTTYTSSGHGHFYIRYQINFNNGKVEDLV